MKLVTAETMKEIDSFTINEIGIPGAVLMENAGRAVAETASRLLRESGLNRVLVVCGPGNNGGDGFVAARHLLDMGFDVRVVLLAEKDRYSGDARTFLDALDFFNAPVEESPTGIDDSTVRWAGKAVVVDAIFGTGLQRPVSGIFADAVDILNTLPGPAVSVDIPSGIDADTGAVLGTAFEADVTVTFGAAKVGHFVWPGRGHSGDVRVVPIGIPGSLFERAPDIYLLGAANVKAAFQPRPPDSYKNTFGHVVVIGGLPGKSGASILAARAAVRAGAGLTSILTTPESAVRIEGCWPDIMVEPALTVKDGWLTFEDAFLQEYLSDKSAVVIGPGLGRLPGTSTLIRSVLSAGLPVIADADALNVMASERCLLEEMRRSSHPALILTPHPGEASRLLDADRNAVQNDRVNSAIDLAAISGSISVLKGAGTVLSAPDGRLAVCDAGTPALAVAGSGDVLAGIIGAIAARGIPPFEAAGAGVVLHGFAGHAAEVRLNEHSVSASDLVELIPEAVKIACGGGIERIQG